MPMNRNLYPANWNDIARAVKIAVDWRCEACGKQCRKPGEKHTRHTHTLTVAHLDHNPANCAPENLRALCAPCHLKYDAPRKAEARRKKMQTKGAAHAADE